MIYAILGLIIIALIVWEYEFARKRLLLKNHSLQDLVENFNIGSGQILLGLFGQALMVFLFEYTYRNHALLKIEKNVLNFILLLLAYDLFMYVMHTLTHKVNFLWGMHLVHHSSNSYNLGLTLRNPWLFSFMYMLPYCLFALIGVPTEFFLAIIGFNGLTQTLQHSRYMGDWGFFGKFLVSPKFHRAHHGAQEEYWDKNMGRMFSFWDKLFGTYVETHDETIEFGIKGRLNSTDAFIENTYYYRYLLELTKRTPGIIGKIKIWIMPPSYRPSHICEIEAELLMGKVLERSVSSESQSRKSLLVCLFNFAYIIGFLMVRKNLAMEEQIYASLFSMLLIGISGYVLARKPASILEKQSKIEAKLFQTI
ncbi:MAG: fatty acid hydroxylase family protein [Deltaproteobacteria bacterium]|nr:MAG: fatty acid hydroxylase family protein [Deltaproteobacteria bacterium]